jgi:hypothetical protein
MQTGAGESSVTFGLRDHAGRTIDLEHDRHVSAREGIREARDDLDEVGLPASPCFLEEVPQMRSHRRFGDAEHRRNVRHPADLNERHEHAQLGPREPIVA